jgi:Arc/MetJ-type ribon-helix-helix transcriptional regulator
LKAYKSRIALRLPKEEREKVEQLIVDRKFKNISHAIRTALNELLKKYEVE